VPRIDFERLRRHTIRELQFPKRQFDPSAEIFSCYELGMSMDQIKSAVMAHRRGDAWKDPMQELRERSGKPIADISPRLRAYVDGIRVAASDFLASEFE
jgi:hypothetical protein